LCHWIHPFCKKGRLFSQEKSRAETDRCAAICTATPSLLTWLQTIKSFKVVGVNFAAVAVQVDEADVHAGEA
ncbi:hypothetical protein, partial [Hominenteromicrobium sp.]|uniref:hypothetical protein n=1 Tax=Hominenteromicrobium sp. TaxID=3073581 RepID=UPI003AF10351